MSRVRRKTLDVFTQGKEPLNYAGNGRLAYAKAAADTSAYVNMMLGRRRKIVGTAWVQSFTGLSTSSDCFIFYHRIGPATRALVFEILAIPADNTAAGSVLGDAPNFYVTMRALGSHVDVVSKTTYVNRRNTGTIYPDDYFLVTARLEPCVPGEDHRIEVVTDNYARAYSCTIYEETDSSLPLRSRANDKNSGVALSIDASGSPAIVLTDPAGEFDSRSYQGCNITLSGWTDAGNNGTFKIAGVTPTTLSYVNASGVTDASPAADSAYEVDDLVCRTPQAVRSILAAEMDDLAQRTYDIWKDGAGHMFSWASQPGVAGTSSSFYINVHDGFSTSFSSTTPGHWIWPEKRGTYESPLVPVTCWAYVKKNSAAGGNCTFRFRNSAGTVCDLAVASTSPVIVTGSGSMDSTLTEDKIDVAFAGNGSTGVTVYGYGMFQAG